jgi:filamentous hemagglutinin family protein
MITMHTKLHSSPLRLSLLASALWVACATQAFAQGLPAGTLPTGWNVTSGNAAITKNGNTLTINQTSQQAIANFATFSVGSNALVDIHQINSSAALLARVNGGDPSQIHGQIRADGALWLINQAGIMVGPGARIDVARFIASSLSVSDSDFLAGRMNFKGTGTPGEVRNEGTINAASGGSIYLVGANVANTGSLNAPQGEVLLAAGQTVQLVDTATPGVSVAITGTPGEVRNMGQITAEAGRIGLAAGLVSNSGTISASSAVREGGRIFLRASGDVRTSATSSISANGTTGGNVVLIAENAASIDGQVSATGSAGRGGYVDTSGHRSLDVVNVPKVGPGGEWHIDPFSIEIVAAGPDAGVMGGSAITSNETGARISVATIVSQLNDGTNVSITTGTGNPAMDMVHGDITVSAAINKTAGGDAALTLNANNNIIINAPITSTSNKLALNLNSNYLNNYPADNHAVQLNANLALNGGALTVSQSGGNANGTLNIAGGTTTLAGGSAINAAGVNVQAGGTLAGTGTLALGGGTLLNNGTVSPGTAGSVGTLSVQGKYTQGSTGVLNIKLAGTDSFDRLAISHTASLNGRLNVRGLNGFVPPAESIYNVVTATVSGSGSFSMVDAPNITSGAGTANLAVSYPGSGTVARITTTASSANICSIAPNSMLCQVLSAAIPVAVAIQPATTAATTASNIILRPSSPGGALFFYESESTPEQVAAMPVSIPAANSTATPDEKKKSDSKDKEGSTKPDVTVAKNEPTKKMYCN